MRKKVLYFVPYAMIPLWTDLGVHHFGAFAWYKAVGVFLIGAATAGLFEWISIGVKDES